MDTVIDRTTRAVEEHLKDFGDAFSKVDENCYFAKKGSALVEIRILPWADDAVVEISANLVEGAELSPVLLRDLLEENHRAVFGKFGIAPGGVVTLQHALLGSTLDKPELVSAVLAVAKNADEWDDKIVARAGGKTALARLREGAKPEAE
jgi:hypothetical protein